MTLNLFRSATCVSETSATKRPGSYGINGSAGCAEYVLRFCALRTRLEIWRTMKRTPPSSTVMLTVSIGQSAPHSSACAVRRTMAGHSTPGESRREDMGEEEKSGLQCRHCGASWRGLLHIIRPKW